MQVGKALELLTAFFEKKAIETPRTDAEWLLAFILNCKRLDLFLDSERLLTLEEQDHLRAAAARRGKREPLQHIIGYVDFYGQKISVDTRVLVPRPETEELIFQLSETWSGNTTPLSLIDMGTGSGAIAIALASLYPTYSISACDISADALLVATENAARNRVASRIQFFYSNWFENIPGRFDWIITNPPYLSTEEWTCAQPEVKEFEPKTALVANNQGLEAIVHLLTEGLSHLNEKGCIVLETGIRQHAYLHAFAKKLGYQRTLTTKDLHHRERFFWAYK